MFANIYSVAGARIVKLALEKFDRHHNLLVALVNG